MTIQMVAQNSAKTNVSSATSDRLMKARCRLMTREPWYGHVAMSMTWIPSEMPWTPEPMRTMGVRIVNGGEVQCMYYPKFVDSLTIEELFAVIQHEIEHIVRVHTIRTGHRNKEAWNIATDMCVNGPKAAPRIGYNEPARNEIIIPFKSKICWIPDQWPKDETSEHYYNLLEKKNAQCCPNCGKPISRKSGKGKKSNGSDGSGGDGDDDGDSSNNGGHNKCTTCGQEDDGNYSYGGITGKAIDNHNIWNQSEVSEDEARQIVQDIVIQATEKCQGHAPGHLAEAIKSLAKPVVRWRELLRHYLGKHVGNQRKTYSRRNRRHDAFGMPGISHHASARVNVIIDTSGSVGTKELEQFFAEIDAISSRAMVKVLQWDHAFQGYSVYRRGDWKRFEVHGRGGTDMAAPINWLCENKLVADVQVMLTDGYCNWPDDKKFPFIAVITTPEGTTDGPTWGHKVRMKVTE